MKQIKELEEELKRLKEEAKTEAELKDKVEATKDFFHNKQTVLDFITHIQKHYKDFGFKYEYELSEILEHPEPFLLGEWTLTVVHVHGGYEGAGDEYYAVVKLQQLFDYKQSSYWLIPGWYSSYSGSELELCDTYQVEPFEKVVIDYRKVGS